MSPGPTDAQTPWLGPSSAPVPPEGSASPATPHSWGHTPSLGGNGSFGATSGYLGPFSPAGSEWTPLIPVGSRGPSEHVRAEHRRPLADWPRQPGPVTAELMENKPCRWPLADSTCSGQGKACRVAMGTPNHGMTHAQPRLSTSFPLWRRSRRESTLGSSMALVRAGEVGESGTQGNTLEDPERLWIPGWVVPHGPMCLPPGGPPALAFRGGKCLSEPWLTAHSSPWCPRWLSPWVLAAAP